LAEIAPNAIVLPSEVVIFQVRHGVINPPRCVQEWLERVLSPA
jgi:hypothetical protein